MNDRRNSNNIHFLQRIKIKREITKSDNSQSIYYSKTFKVQKCKSQEYASNTFGPIVTFTASATSDTPCNIAARAPIPKLISFAT